MTAAERGIWKSTEMRRRLADAGLDISAGKMSALWTGTPTSIRLDDLDVICSVLACTPTDLLICEPDDGREDVQTLARITLSGAATPIPPEEHAQARERYLARLPAAAPLFDFPDFGLFRLVPQEARYVGGFARAYTLTPAHLRQAAQL